MLEPELLRAGLFMVSDLSRGMLLVWFWIFAFEVLSIRNGLMIRRFAQFVLVQALMLTWINLVYADRRFDLVPGFNLWHDTFEWNWIWHLALLVTLVRLWTALRTHDGSYQGGRS